MTAICTKILQIRKDYAKRRSLANRTVVKAARLISRRERMRKGKLTSMKLIKSSIRGRLRLEDREERRRLEQAAIESREDVERSLLCLRQVTLYIDDVVLYHNKDAKYRAWEMALDLFLKELKHMVHYSIKPRRRDVKMVDKLIRMLQQMRIAEKSTEQVQIRWGLEDGLSYLLEDANRRFRRMGL